jgi:hypothetical protein
MQILLLSLVDIQSLTFTVCLLYLQTETGRKQEETYVCRSTVSVMCTVPKFKYILFTTYCRNWLMITIII